MRSNFLWRQAETRYWTGRLCSTEDLFALQQTCFHSDTIHGSAEEANGGGGGTVSTPSLEEWMCQIIQGPPLGQSCRCTCGYVHVQLLRTVFAPPAKNVVISHFLPLTRSSCVSFLFAFIFFLWLRFFFPNQSTSASPSLTKITPPLALQVP